MHSFVFKLSVHIDLYFIYRSTPEKRSTKIEASEKNSEGRSFEVCGSDMDKCVLGACVPYGTQFFFYKFSAISEIFQIFKVVIVCVCVKQYGILYNVHALSIVDI